MDNIKELQEKCICRMCPSYRNCGEPIAFCLPEVESSKCIAAKSGCMCPGCPVQEIKGYTGSYYCIPGQSK